jgi:hypothetical protein
MKDQSVNLKCGELDQFVNVITHYVNNSIVLITVLYGNDGTILEVGHS